jgi:1,4-dihydroxy-2-naphthoate octaprenyltransferase
MNFTMWGKALRIIPRIDQEEWKKLDIISKWLIASRAAVLVMTFLSAAIAGILAASQGMFHFGYWLLLAIGLVMAHATNNLLNDYTDYSRGVDQDNYYRAQYGPQPLVHGLMTKGELLRYAFVSGMIALAAGLPLVVLRGWTALILLLLGAFFVLFYTWPLKYIALGEIAVLIVWGPLMIGGGYFVITGEWDWQVVLAGLPYALGVTGVIFGKHIDKFEVDKMRKIYTLPVVIGEKAARLTLIGLLILQYILVIYLVLTKFFSPFLLIVLFALTIFRSTWSMLIKPRPAEKPADYPDVWPNYFVAAAFIHNRRFGVLFLLGLFLDLAWNLIQGLF